MIAALCHSTRAVWGIGTTRSHAYADAEQVLASKNLQVVGGWRHLDYVLIPTHLDHSLCGQSMYVQLTNSGVDTAPEQTDLFELETTKI